ncbi:MAG TPA: hypothetical protein VJ508_19295, partial [Saprospiraceae bacterium]|nr:hypothetical protein [Saprospiraceae bacterium]
MFSLRGRFWMPWFAGIIFLWPVMGQNLLPNPDFETNTHCPNGPGNGNPSDMPPWQDATLGTCDYFSECATSVFAKVPKNNF